jgi:hypothetical protein
MVEQTIVKDHEYVTNLGAVDHELTPIIERLSSAFPVDYKHKIKRRLLAKKQWTPAQFELYFYELQRFLYSMLF